MQKFVRTVNTTEAFKMKIRSLGAGIQNQITVH